MLNIKARQKEVNMLSEKKKPGAYSGYTQARTVERISLVVPKGHKADIKAHAEQRGESVNGFINRAIDEAMERDKGE